MPSIKKIYVEDFGALETEALKIDYLRFNLKSDLSDNEIATLATYFRRVGFSSYKKNSVDIVLILTLNLYCMLLSYDSDTVNIVTSYIKYYIHI